MNLLKETEKALKNHNLTMKNVKYILNAEGYIPIADFVAAAQNIEYDNGWGVEKIDMSLKIVGACWWLERGEYDGSEGWIFHKKPALPELPATGFDLTTYRGMRYHTEKRYEK